MTAEISAEHPKRKRMSHSMLGRAAERGNQCLSCFNCAKKGHKKADCWAEGGGKAGQGPKVKGDGKVMERGKRIRKGEGISCGCERGCCMDGHVRCFPNQTAVIPVHLPQT